MLNIRKAELNDVDMLLDMKLDIILSSEEIAELDKRELEKIVNYSEEEIRENLEDYKIIEDEFGSSFISLKRFNGCRYLDDFKSIEYGIIYQDDLSIDIINRLIENIKTNNIKEIDELVGRNRGFLNRKTIYKVIR